MSLEAATSEAASPCDEAILISTERVEDTW